jgi:hypothetical protein
MPVIGGGGETPLEVRQQQQPCYGLYRGTVANIHDPLNQGRIVVNLPGLPNPTVWALPCREPNSHAIPAINDEVWIMFEHGDPSKGVWIGVK